MGARKRTRKLNKLFIAIFLSREHFFSPPPPPAFYSFPLSLPAEAKAIILGQSDLYVKMGSKVVLTCVISQGPHDLGTISWHRGEYIEKFHLIYMRINFAFSKMPKTFLSSTLHSGRPFVNEISASPLKKRFNADQSNSS